MQGCIRRRALGCAALLLAGCVSGDHRQELADPVALRPIVAPIASQPPPFAPKPKPASPADIAKLVRPPDGIKSGKWEYVVIHHSATPSGNARSFHVGHLRDRGWQNGLGYHFVIGNGNGAPDGAVEVGPRWHKQMTGAHCNTGDNRYNRHGIGICLVGNFEVDSPTPAQMANLEHLVRYLSDVCDIAPDHIRVHGELKETLCPGRNFSLAGLKNRLARKATPSTTLLSASP